MTTLSAQPFLEKVPERVDGRLAQHDLEHDAGDTDGDPTTTTTTSSSSTPSDSSTTPSAGRVSSPVNGGARKAPADPPITSSPKTMLLKRWSNRKRKRGWERRSSRRIHFMSPLMKRC